MLRRLYHDQPESFAFTEANREWAEAQITKYPEGRQASAVIALLWRAQEQEGWLTRPAMEEVARMLGMAYIRVLEVATFYFMFQLQPVGRVAHIQVCGTTSCMICGAEDLISVCRQKIAPRPHEISADGKFSWEEVECLGACANAPMAQIGKDYYEDLTAETLGKLIDRMAAGEVPVPGSQIGRFASEPAAGLTSLEMERHHEGNASVTLATEIGDTLKRIDGTEVPLRAPWTPVADSAAAVPPSINDDLLPPRGAVDKPTPGAQPGRGKPVSPKATTRQETDADNKARPDEGEVMGGDATIGEGQGRTPGHAPAGDTGDHQAPGRETSSHDGAGPLSGGDDTEGRAAGQPARAGDDADPANEAAAAIPEGEERRPETLEAPREGGADDLKRVRGIGPRLEEALNAMGIYHLDQIASWQAAELAWVDRNIEGFRGRAIRDDWVGQAKVLLRGEE